MIIPLILCWLISCAYTLVFPEAEPALTIRTQTNQKQSTPTKSSFFPLSSSIKISDQLMCSPLMITWRKGMCFFCFFCVLARVTLTCYFKPSHFWCLPNKSGQGTVDGPSVHMQRHYSSGNTHSKRTTCRFTCSRGYTCTCTQVCLQKSPNNCVNTSGIIKLFFFFFFLSRLLELFGKDFLCRDTLCERLSESAYLRRAIKRFCST